jgi:hypothetical protein
MGVAAGEDKPRTTTPRGKALKLVSKVPSEIFTQRYAEVRKRADLKVGSLDSGFLSFSVHRQS